MSPAYQSSEIKHLVANGLEKTRRSLLDLSGRNRLLNFKFTGSKLVRFIDEIPNQIFFDLMERAEGTDRKGLEILPIPLPKKGDYPGVENLKAIDVKTHATKLGFACEWQLSTIYNADEKKHNDGKLQTLCYPEQLDRTLRRIQSEAKTAIEESGVNMLFLCLGFLKWTDSDVSKMPNYAPLILIPIEIEREKKNNTQTGFAKFGVRYTGEDILDNICLREKLSQFSIQLPSFDSFESPEQYFQQIERDVREIKPEWSIERFANTGFLAFGKMLMYLDLDPERWPLDDGLLDSQHIIDIYTGNQMPGRVLNQDYDIDFDPQIPQVPLVMDSDSSQHSAIIDALQGKSIVIEGPPGTGKSQTITNLIAANLAADKSVLFVAEKLAALEVVRKRLDKVGLGRFCLELHSHKSQKKAILDDLKNRIDFDTEKLKESASKAERAEVDLSQKKKKLVDYVVNVNKPMLKIQDTPYNIFWTTEVLYKKLTQPYQAELFERPGEVEVLTKSDLARNSEQVRIYSEKLTDYFESEQRTAHFWEGFYVQTPINFSEEEDVFNLLRDLSKSATEANKSVYDLASAGFKDLPIENWNLIELQLNSLTSEDYNRALAFSTSEPLQIGQVIESLSLLDSAIRTEKLLNDELVENSLSLGMLTTLHNAIDSHSPDIPDKTAFKTFISAYETLAMRLDLMEKTQPILAESASILRTSIANEDQASVDLAISRVCKQIDRTILPLRSDFIESAIDSSMANEIAATVASLRQDRLKLEREVDLSIAPDDAELQELKEVLQSKGLFSFLMPKWRSAMRLINRFYRLDATDTVGVAKSLERLSKYRFESREFAENIHFRRTFPNVFEGVETDLDRLNDIVDFYRIIQRELLDISTYGNSLYAEIKDAPAHVFDWYAKKYEAFDTYFQQQSDCIEALKDAGMTVSVPSFGNLFETSKVLSIQTDKIRSILANGSVSGNLTLSKINSLRNSLSEYSLAVNSFNENQLARDMGVTFDIRYAQSIRKRLEELSKVLRKTEGIPNAANALILSSNGFDFVQSILPKVASITKYLHSRNQLTENLPIAFNFTEFWQTSNGSNTVTIDLIVTKLENVKLERESFSKWCDLLNHFSQLKSLGLGSIITSFYQKKAIEVPFSEYELLYKYLVYVGLSNRVLREDSNLGTFSRITHEHARKSFKEIDEELKKLNSEALARRISRKIIPQGVGGRSPKEFTNLTLIRHELTKQKAHIPIRQLLARSYDALVALKPCFMMGPLSVAQYLAPKAEKFDVLIMDEASQVKPEDAIGLFARAKQVIIVGDSNQLPPTGFFDTIGENVGDEEESVIDNSESILEVCRPILQGVRRLKWHYRSQHQSLISFSNRHFYEDDLVVFPSPVENSETVGVKHILVEDGVYHNQSNLVEAQRVVEDLVQLASQFPERSFGIVTLNKKQAMVIEDEIERVRNQDPIFNQFLTDSKHEDQLFVKNLENVQGDERDVILISTTFGKDNNGNFLQHFGPIVGKNGWRRLNVLFTRAKQHIRIFSSFRGGDLRINDRKEQRGLQALSDYLLFAAKGIDHSYSSTRNEPDNDFEKAVGGCLVRNGYDIEYQLGVSGYLIDIVVKHPRFPSNYVIAVECDGATYHSAKTARDRDRLREGHLRNLGWGHIHRIWSTDWFRRRVDEEKRLLSAVEIAIRDFDSSLGS